MKTVTVLFLALFSVVAAGCAAIRQEAMAEANAPTANVAGVWSGSAGTGGDFVPVNVTLAQTGTKVTGTISIGGRPDLSGPINGSVQGELLKLSLATVTLGELRARQDTITGEVSAGLPVTLRRSP